MTQGTIDPLWKAPRHDDYYTRQFATPYRSTVHLEAFARRVLGDARGARRVIDVGCGSGAVIYHLHGLLPSALWVGIDLSSRHFAAGKAYLDGRGRVDLVQGDFYRLSSTFAPKSFDHAFVVQTLSWCPAYEPVLAEVAAITRSWIFVTSLFSDFAVEATIQLTDYSSDPQGVGPLHYNVYSLPRFEAFCRALGAVDLVVEDFNIDLDLDPPPLKGIGTYTRRLEGGQRMQFSGPVALPWKAIAIRMSRDERS